MIILGLIVVILMYIIVKGIKLYIDTPKPPDGLSYREYNEYYSEWGNIEKITGNMDIVVANIRLGKRMDAVKELRAQTGCSLASAMKEVERIASELQNYTCSEETYEEYEGASVVDGMDGHDFEYFCAELLLKNGFTKAVVTPGSGDQGVDILAEKDGIKYAVQCKNYSSPLGNTPVQEVSAGKTFYGCHVGVVLTNSTFTPGAISLANATGVLLWDRNTLAELMRNERLSTEKVVEGSVEIPPIVRPRDATPAISASQENPPQSPKQKKSVLFLVFILLCTVFAFGGIFPSKTTAESITLEDLQTQSHPKVADNEDYIEEYYKGITGVCFEHASDFKSEKTGVLTWHYTSVYGDDTLNDVVIDFSKLSTDDQTQLTFEKVWDIAISFVPVEEILEYYTFDKAIYVEREDHVAHELYYREKEERVADRPSKFFQDHGFSIVIKEYQNGHFKVLIETSWYDIAYHIGGGAFPQLKDMKEDLAKHQEWKFSLEECVNGGE